MSLQLVDNFKLDLELTFGEECWLVTCKKLDIYATGKTLEIALVDFSEQLTYFYYHYIELPDRKCLQHALDLKRTYKTTFKDIVE